MNKEVESDEVVEDIEDEEEIEVEDDLEVGPELGEEGDGAPVLQVAVQVLLEAGLDERGEVGDHAGRDGDLGEHVHLGVVVVVVVMRL